VQSSIPLAEIHLQPKPSYFPLSLWGNLILGMFFVAICLCVLFIYKHRQKNRARRYAIAQIKQLNNLDDLGKMNTILKQVALSYCGRSAVASLSGHEWFVYLDAHVSEKYQGFCEDENKWFEGLYRSNILAPEDFEQCKSQALTWIKQAKFSR